MKKARSLNQILMSGLGKAWMAWPPRNEVKRRCRVEGKPGWYRCEMCKAERERVEIDHIIPVVKPQEGFTTWDQYIASKFVQADKLQGLCRECHKAKSKAENKIRAEARRAKKPKRKKLQVTEADLDEFAKRFKGATDAVTKADGKGRVRNQRRVSGRVLSRQNKAQDKHRSVSKRDNS